MTPDPDKPADRLFRPDDLVVVNARVNVRAERVLALTLALRTARRFVVAYLRIMEAIGWTGEATKTRHALHMIDEALK